MFTGTAVVRWLTGSYPNCHCVHWDVEITTEQREKEVGNCIIMKDIATASMINCAYVSEEVIEIDVKNKKLYPKPYS